MKLNTATTTTTQWPDRAPAPQGTLPTGNPKAAYRGISIGHLDRRAADPQGGCPTEVRTLWVSLINPRSLLGPLLDEMSFEGAWLETDGQARIRLAGQAERRIRTPLFHSDEAARSWLASELLKNASLSEDLGFPGSREAGPESLAA